MSKRDPRHNPAWENAEEIDQQNARVKQEVSHINSRLKNVANVHDREVLLKKKTILQNDSFQLEQTAREERNRADSIYFAAFDLDIKNPSRQEETHEYTSEELMAMLEKSFSKSHSLLEQMRQEVL